MNTYITNGYAVHRDVYILLRPMNRLEVLTDQALQEMHKTAGPQLDDRPLFVWNADKRPRK